MSFFEYLYRRANTFMIEIGLFSSFALISPNMLDPNYQSTYQIGHARGIALAISGLVLMLGILLSLLDAELKEARRVDDWNWGGGGIAFIGSFMRPASAGLAVLLTILCCTIPYESGTPLVHKVVIMGFMGPIALISGFCCVGFFIEGKRNMLAQLRRTAYSIPTLD